MERQATHRQRLQAAQSFRQDQPAEPQAIQPAQRVQAIQQRSPDLWQIAFHTAAQITTKVALVAVEAKSESHLKEWKRHRDVDDAIAILVLRVLHRGIERLDESLGN
jgi:hypothetical protein